MSPSSSIAKFPKRLERSISELKSLGLDVVVGENALKTLGDNAGTPQDRAGDINSFFADPQIKAIIASTGGYGSNAVLPLLDYKLIENNPKIFCGFSDITALNLAIYSMTDLITFSGPMLLPSFGDFGGILSFTRESFTKAVFSTEVIGDLKNATEYTDEYLSWDQDDSRPRILQKATSARVVVESKNVCEGKLIGGNLTTLSTLIGTNFFPKFMGGILFLEETKETLALVERNLFHLEQAGVFSEIKGLIFGRPSHIKEESDQVTIDNILRYFGEKYDFPIITDIDLGHTNPMLTIPIGVSAKIDTSKVLLTITEPAVV